MSSAGVAVSTDVGSICNPRERGSTWSPREHRTIFLVFQHQLCCLGWRSFVQTQRGNESMKTNHKLAVAVLIGVAIGVAFATSIHARQVKAPAGYVIAEVDVQDPAMFQKYAEKVPGTLAPFNGHYIVRGGKVQAVEGEAPKRFVVIAFDSAEKAKSWEDSPA